MAAIVCLIADPVRWPLDEALVRTAAAAVEGGTRWLGAAAALEIRTELQAAAARARLLPIIAGLPLDLAILPPGERAKRLLVADMDSTMITIECIDELAGYVGIKAQVAETTRRAMNGEIDFATALRERVALLAGVPITSIDEICRERIRAMPGAATLVRTMRAHGARTVLVSGGFSQFTGFVRRLLGFDVDEANRLEVVDGRLTGRLVGEIRDARSKLEALHRHAADLGVAAAAALAVGDGANDLPMIEAAGLGVAFRAHPRVKARAPVTIDHGDLTALLYLQGYAASDFVRS
jgi:phosphoserine phosphatase